MQAHWLKEFWEFYLIDIANMINGLSFSWMALWVDCKL